MVHVLIRDYLMPHPVRAAIPDHIRQRRRKIPETLVPLNKYFFKITTVAEPGAVINYALSHYSLPKTPTFAAQKIK